MTAKPVETHFSDTCSPVYLGNCTVGTKYIDPCACERWYQCNVAYAMISQVCSTGTGYDPSTTGCINIDDLVFSNKCIQRTPWTRCINVTGDRMAELAHNCGGNITTTPAAPEATTSGVTGGSDNTGAIVGGVIGGLILVALVVVGYLIWKRKVNLSGSSLSRKASQPVDNPQYFSGESVYATINDHMHEPTYMSDITGQSSIQGTQGASANGFAQTNTLGSDISNRSDSYLEPSPKVQHRDHTRDLPEAVYDNPGLQVHDEENFRYSTLTDRATDRDSQRYHTLVTNDALITVENDQSGYQNTHI